MGQNSRENQVVLVDKSNNRIGIEEKIKAHKEGKLHRAFSIFIFNSKDEILIQQRATTKYHSGGLWSNTVCSHPRPDESYELATHRRLKEEMGFDCKLKKVFCFIYNAGFRNDLIENEYDCIYLGEYSGKIKPSSNEIMDYKWVTIQELIHDIEKNPGQSRKKEMLRVCALMESNLIKRRFAGEEDSDAENVRLDSLEDLESYFS